MSAQKYTKEQIVAWAVMRLIWKLESLGFTVEYIPGENVARNLQQDESSEENPNGR